MSLPATRLARLRTWALRTILTSFSLAALLGVVVLLFAAFDETTLQVILTTLVVGAASIAALCHLMLASIGGVLARVVVAAGVASALAFCVLALLLIWWDRPFSADLGEPFGVSAVATASTAQASLLLSLGERLPRRLRLVLAGTLGLIVVVGGMLTALILGTEPDEDVYFRVLGTAAILDALGSVVLVAVALFGRGPEAPGRAATAPVQVTLPAGLAARVDERAAASGRSRDELVAEAVGSYLDQPPAPGPPGPRSP